jgi:hypothetical protein
MYSVTPKAGREELVGFPGGDPNTNCLRDDAVRRYLASTK